jgi:hypothetical protein
LLDVLLVNIQSIVGYDPVKYPGPPASTKWSQPSKLKIRSREVIELIKAKWQACAEKRIEEQVK